jgi:hypothetical protein
MKSIRLVSSAGAGAGGGPPPIPPPDTDPPADTDALISRRLANLAAAIALRSSGDRYWSLSSRYDEPPPPPPPRMLLP